MSLTKSNHRYDFLWSLKLVEIYAQARWNNRKKQNTPFTGRWWIWNEKELGFLNSKQKTPHNDVNNPCVCVSDVILRFFPHLKKQRFDFVLKFPTFSWHFVDLLKFIIEKNTDQRLGQGKYSFFMTSSSWSAVKSEQSSCSKEIWRALLALQGKKNSWMFKKIQIIS